MLLLQHLVASGLARNVLHLVVLDPLFNLGVQSILNCCVTVVQDDPLPHVRHDKAHISLNIQLHFLGFLLQPFPLAEASGNGAGCN